MKKPNYIINKSIKKKIMFLFHNTFRYTTTTVAAYHSFCKQ